MEPARNDPMKINTRHANELMSRLDQLWTLGCAVIRYDELKYWYGRDRVTASIWKDINNRWISIAEEAEWNSEGRTVPKLLIGDNGKNDSYVLVWGEENWLAPIEEYTSAKADKATEAVEEGAAS
jgi:hypothetical protein